MAPSQPQPLSINSILSDLTKLKQSPNLFEPFLPPPPKLPSLTSSLSNSQDEPISTLQAVQLSGLYLNSCTSFLKKSEGVERGEERIERLRSETEEILRGLE